MDGLPFPAVSANTLFHFTNNLENLLGILTNEFQPRFCLEDYDCIAPSSAPDGETTSGLSRWYASATCRCHKPDFIYRYMAIMALV